MKKKIAFALLLGMSMNLQAKTTVFPGGGESDEVINLVTSRIETDGSLTLSVDVIDSLSTIEVGITGDIQGWATLALTNSKGEEVFFQLIEDSHTPLSISIPTENLKTGFYFVQLDWEQEIRILKIRID